LKSFVVVFFNHFSVSYIPFVVYKIRFQRRASINKRLFWTGGLLANDNTLSARVIEPLILVKTHTRYLTFTIYGIF